MTQNFGSFVAIKFQTLLGALRLPFSLNGSAFLHMTRNDRESLSRMINDNLSFSRLPIAFLNGPEYWKIIETYTT